MQIGTVDHPVRCPVPLRDPFAERQLRQQVIRCAIVDAQACGFAHYGFQPIGNPEPREDADRIGPKLYPGTRFGWLLATFQNPAWNPMPRQCDRKREAADTSPSNQDGPVAGHEIYRPRPLGRPS